VFLIWALLFICCFQLGYPIVNRYDPGTFNPDASEYRQLVIHGSSAVSRHFQHRVLIPYLAHRLYAITDGHLGTWDAGYFALLVINSVFVSATAVLVLMITLRIGGSANMALLAAAFYLLNYAVSDLMLSGGYVDSGEAFFFALIVLALMMNRWWILPIAAVLGTLTKETFLPFCAVFTLVWTLADRESPVALPRRLLWSSIAVLCAFATITIALSVTNGGILLPWTYAGSLHELTESKVRVAFSAITSRHVWYVFAYLLPLGLMRVRRMPLSWRLASLATTAVAFVFAIYHNGAGDAGPAFSRPAFSIAGPLLTSSMTLFLCGDLFSGREP
jgi:uncharacterized membrane protein